MLDQLLQGNFSRHMYLLCALVQTNDSGCILPCAVCTVSAGGGHSANSTILGAVRLPEGTGGKAHIGRYTCGSGCCGSI